MTSIWRKSIRLDVKRFEMLTKYIADSKLIRKTTWNDTTRFDVLVDGQQKVVHNVSDDEAIKTLNALEGKKEKLKPLKGAEHTTTYIG